MPPTPDQSVTADRAALTALQELVEEIHRGGEVPLSMRNLN